MPIQFFILIMIFVPHYSITVSSDRKGDFYKVRYTMLELDEVKKVRIGQYI